MSTGIPVAFPLTCPRCKILRSFVNVDGGTLFRCSACEWYWTLSTLRRPRPPWWGVHDFW